MKCPATGLLGLLSAILLAGCSEEPAPTRSVSYGSDILQMVVSNRWEIWSEANDERDQQVYSRKVVFQVRLHAAGGLCGPKACVPHSSA